MRMTTKIRSALRDAANVASAHVAGGDFTQRQIDGMPDALAWLEAVHDKAVVALTLPQICALVKWANVGIKSTEGDTKRDRDEPTAIKAMQAMIEAAGGTHEMYGGMVRHDLSK